MINKTRSLCSTALLASVMTLAPLASQAASPVFDNWSVTGGTIAGPGNTTPCSTGFTCETLSIGDGFIQVQWVDAVSGVTYIQTVITDTGAAGNPGDLPYVDESFVRLGSENGIMAQQRHAETDDLGGQFTNSSQLAIGWANPTPDADNPNMIINQSFQSAGEAGVVGDEFSNTFAMLIIQGTGDEAQTGDRSITVDQRVGLGDGVTGTDDVQRFLLEGRRGAFTTAGSLELGAPTGNVGGAEGGGTVSWADGDDVMVRWIGQRLDLDSEGQSLFGFQGIVNNSQDLDDATREATTFSTSSTGIEEADGGGYVPPFNWHETFGAVAPTPELPPELP